MAGPHLQEANSKTTAMRLLFFLSLLAACSQNRPVLNSPKPVGPLIFIGTYTEKLGHVDGKASGIYTARLDTTTGQLTVIDSVCDLANPSFLTVSPDRKHLFAVGENGGSAARPFGSVAAYDIGEQGKLRKINEISAYGIAPCHISTDREGRFVFIANYVTGDIISYKIRPGGGLTDSICRVKHPGKTTWAHQILQAPGAAEIWSVDKGADAIFRFDLTDDGRLSLKNRFSTAAGDGPRHLDFHPKIGGRFAVVNELSSSVWLCQVDEKTGKTSVLDTISTLPASFSGSNSCAEIQWHPNGKWLFASNRGHNSLAIFGVNEASGKLTSLGHEPTRGEFPRSFLVTADGKWLLAANQNSGSVAVFCIDRSSGKLTAAGLPSRVATPVCLKMW